MNYFEANTKALSRTNPLYTTLNHLVKRSHDLTSDTMELIETYEKKIALLMKDNGKVGLLHSKYNIAKENELILSSIDTNKDQLIIVFGIGLTYHIKDLKKKLTPDSRVFIIEYNLNLVNYLVSNIDMMEIFDDDRFILISGTDTTIEQMIIAYFGLNFYNLVLNMKLINLPNYYKIYKERIANTVKSINRRILTQIYSYGNSLIDIFNGFNNNYKNIDACIQSNGFNEIENIYKDYPAIIVASGPSLDKNISELSKANNKAIILSCDASINACEKAGIIPDCVASIERDPEIYEYYYKNKSFNDKLVLVGPTLLWPTIFEKFTGKKILSTKMNDGVEQWWADQFDAIQYMDTGQSSATYAFATAVKMGCNPIILIGQDLGYSEGKIHSDLTHHTEQGDNDDRWHDGIFLEDEEGNLLRSNIGYRLFKEWYEIKILADDGLKVINATEGGAYIQGTTRMTLRDAIETYCTKTKDTRVYDHLEKREITNLNYIKKYNQIIDNINIELNKVDKVVETAKPHKKKLDSLLVDINSLTESDLEKIVKEMSVGDKVINYVLHDEETETIRNYYKQIIVQTISHVKGLGNELTAYNVKRNYELQLNLMNIIIDSSKIIKDKYEEMRAFIIAKRDERMRSEEC